MKSLHIFTRDLRIKDNNSLNNLVGTEIYPIFIFTPQQITNNKYKSDNAIQFMIESLKDLNRELNNNLGLFYGDFEKIVNNIIEIYDINKISITKDYTPFAIERENILKKLCEKKYKNDVQLIITDDYFLTNYDIKLYKKYTPYKNITISEKIKNVKTNPLNIKKVKSQFSFTQADKLYSRNNNINLLGGRKNGLIQLSKIKQNKQFKYDKNRNYLDKHTTELSAYIKFGCLSIREVYWEFKKINSITLIQQLIWRDFYYQLSKINNILSKPLKEKYSNIKWDNNENYFNAWKTGNTGFPIVDAGMKQLNNTGFMHNRARLITASFLVKTLLIDWKWGEHYFATKLYDYDPLVNNGNWQWVAGSGADSQPYFRIFNPWLQSKSHDPECKYIKKWIPELKDINPKEIHKWYKYFEKYKTIYKKPIVDFDKQKNKVLNEYKKLF